MASAEKCEALKQAAETEYGTEFIHSALTGWMLAILSDEDADRLLRFHESRMEAAGEPR